METTQTPIHSRVLKMELINWQQMQFIQDDNFKVSDEQEYEKVKKSLGKHSFIDTFNVWQEPTTGIIWCMDGKRRSIVLHKLMAEGENIPALLPAIFIDAKNKKEAAELVLIYSSEFGRITLDGLQEHLKAYEIDYSEMQTMMSLPDFNEIEFSEKFGEDADKQIKITNKSLLEQFIIPPFSVLDSRQGYWQDRKRQWLSLGFDSQETREDIEVIAQSGQAPNIYSLKNKMRNSLKREPSWEEIIAYAKKKNIHIYEGASIFDPVLAEICYKWFCTENGKILDPFAGGSVRGIVASILGFRYTGIDLRQDQVEANRRQADKLLSNVQNPVKWIIGDSNVELENVKEEFDFVFSCPPYHDLEKYTDDAKDLSNMDYEEFLAVYRSIIEKSIAKLKNNRFACFVVGDVRDEKGFYKNFVSDTISAFKAAGMEYYNEMVLINVAGSLPIRVGRQFSAGRKVGKMHQNVLVFFKGDANTIRNEFPKISEIGNFNEFNKDLSKEMNDEFENEFNAFPEQSFDK